MVQAALEFQRISVEFVRALFQVVEVGVEVIGGDPLGFGNAQAFYPAKELEQVAVFGSGAARSVTQCQNILIKSFGVVAVAMMIGVVYDKVSHGSLHFFRTPNATGYRFWLSMIWFLFAGGLAFGLVFGDFRTPVLFYDD
jgi:hypothetical protein